MNRFAHTAILFALIVTVSLAFAPSASAADVARHPGSRHHGSYHGMHQGIHHGPIHHGPRHGIHHGPIHHGPRHGIHHGPRHGHYVRPLPPPRPYHHHGIHIHTPVVDVCF